jgi:hypothetical protein
MPIVTLTARAVSRSWGFTRVGFFYAGGETTTKRDGFQALNIIP